MSYLVFARKYRPQQFEDLVAQEHVSRTLVNSIKNDRVGSAYLFCGPRGTGKTTTARILAKCLNCEKGPTPTPCGQCDACKDITAGSSLDVLEIDAASNTGVDDIRVRRENVRYMATGGHKRIYIIDEVHRLSGAAFDALLKTLEEPPSHVVFICATTDPLKVPDTILSRTQRFDFKRISPTDISNHLKKIANLEKIEIDEEALRILSRKADGSIRDALSLLDQITAFAGDKIRAADVVDALGLVDKALLFDFTNAIASHDSKEALKIIGRVVEAGTDVLDFTSELMEHFRILMILTADQSAADELGFTIEETTQYKEQAGCFSLGDVIRLIKMAGELNADIKFGLNERMVLEVTAVRMAEMEATVKFEEVLEQLKEIGPQVSGNLFGLTEKKNSNDLNKPISRLSIIQSPETITEPASPSPKSFNRTVNLPMVQKDWSEYLNHLRSKSAMLSSQIRMGSIRDVKENIITIAFAKSAANSREILERPDNFRLITEDLRTFFDSNVSLKLEIDDSSGAAPAAMPEKKKGITREEVEKLVSNSPRLKKLIEDVDGEIIGVKKLD